MVAKLQDLLTDKEISCLFYKIDIQIEVQQLSIKDLSDIGLDIIKTKYGERMPPGSIAGITIGILTDRAIEKNIGIFD